MRWSTASGGIIQSPGSWENLQSTSMPRIAKSIALPSANAKARCMLISASVPKWVFSVLLSCSQRYRPVCCSVEQHVVCPTQHTPNLAAIRVSGYQFLGDGLELGIVGRDLRTEQVELSRHEGRL